MSSSSPDIGHRIATLALSYPLAAQPSRLKAFPFIAAPSTPLDSGLLTKIAGWIGKQANKHKSFRVQAVLGHILDMRTNERVDLPGAVDMGMS